MKRLIALALMIMALCFFALPGFAARNSLNGTTATICRTTATLTTSDVIGTTFSLPQDAVGVYFYVEVDKGSLTNVIFQPCGAIDGNPAATGYYRVPDAKYTYTWTADGFYVVYVPAEAFGAPQYVSMFVRGTGTATSSGCQVWRKILY